MKTKSKKELTFISLFSGCGGFDCGFHKQGYKCLGAYEIDPSIVQVYKQNFKSPVYVHDLTNFNLPGNLPKEVDVIISGSPCQGFSTIGKRKLNDPRNHLLLAGGQIAIKYKAKVFVCENVLGSNSGKHKKYWTKLINLLKQNEYNTQIVKYCASEFGVPQTRKRLILYAWKNQKLLNPELISKNNIFSSLKDVFKNTSDLMNHNLDFIKSNSNELKIAKKILPGQKLCNVRGGDRSVHSWDIPEVFGEVDTTEKHFLHLLMKLRRQIRRRKNGDADPVEYKFLYDYFEKDTKGIIDSLIKKGYIKRVDKKYLDICHSFNGKFKRLSLNNFSPTVDTRFGSYKNFLHPSEHRGISVREAARIQGFLDTFIFSGSLAKQYQMVGNAVPPPLAEFIAKTIKQNIIPFI